MNNRSTRAAARPEVMRSGTQQRFSELAKDDYGAR
jgi:hypothetical protein